MCHSLNGDELINVQDVVTMVNIVLGPVDDLYDYLCAADLNQDETINVQDVILLVNLILNTDGVVSQVGIQVFSLAGTTSGRLYSPLTINIVNATSRGIIVPPPGGIFEMRFPNDDIIGSAV